MKKHKFISVQLKGSYDVRKKNIILYMWCKAMCLRGLRLKKNTLFSTYCTLLLLLSGPPFWNALIFTKLIVLKSEVCSDWPAIQCFVIGRIPQACDGNVTPLTIFGNTYSASTIWRQRQQYYSENKSYAFFLCVNIWAVLCNYSNTVT